MLKLKLVELLIHLVRLAIVALKTLGHWPF